MDKYLLFGGLMIATVGAIKDLRGRTIPNWLSYSGILSGLTFRVAMAAWPALKSGFLGLLIGGGFFYLLFLAGGMFGYARAYGGLTLAMVMHFLHNLAVVAYEALK